MILDELTHPIVQAPMAGGPSTPALAAAVSGAGGLGFTAAGYLSPERMEEDFAAVRSVTRAPFGVNLFVPGSREVDEPALRAYVVELGSEAARYGVEVGEAHFDDDRFEAKVARLRERPMPIVSFTFGCPPAELVSSLKAVGSETWVTVTSPAEARAARQVGADVLVLQGIEAGGHRGGFADDVSEGLSTLALLRLVASELEAVPLVAAGGIADGAGVAAALAAGATAVQLGSAFMLCPEAATNPAHREALTAPGTTALTRAFSGRLARGIENRFMREHEAGAPSAYPQVHHATSPIRAVARERGDPGGFNLWAGQAHELARALPAAELVRALSADARAALERAQGRLTG